MTVTWDGTLELQDEGGRGVSYLLLADKSLLLSVWVTSAEIKEMPQFCCCGINLINPKLRQDLLGHGVLPLCREQAK